MEQLVTINFLKSFFALFQAQLEAYEILKKQVAGTIGWLNEADKQDFIFRIDFDILLLNKVKLLCDFLREKHLVHGDKIVVSEYNLLKILKMEGWDEIEAKEAVNCLCSLDVKMVDNKEETDSFFLHF